MLCKLKLILFLLTMCNAFRRKTKAGKEHYTLDSNFPILSIFKNKAIYVSESYACNAGF